MDIGKILNGGPQGTWYSMPGASEVRVKIRNIKPSRQREIYKRTTKRKVRGGQYVTQLDEVAFSDALLCECVEDWQGIEQEGVAFDCTDENKRLLDDNWPEFNRLWNTVIGQLNDTENFLEEAELGN